MAIRITSSNGLGHSTQIVDTETGQDLTKLLAVEYGATITLDELVKLQANLILIECVIDSQAVEWRTKNPATDTFEPVASITFRDGSRVNFAEDGSVTTTGPEHPVAVVARCAAEINERVEEFRDRVDETRDSIRRGARRSKHRFKL